MYLDLGVAWDAKRDISMADQALRFGFSGIAYNLILSVGSARPQELLSQRKSMAPRAVLQKAKGKQSSFNGPFRHSLAESLGFQQPGPLLQLRRVTLLVADGAQLSVANQVARRRSPDGFDLVAFRPTTDEAWQLICEGGECDFVSFCLEERLPFPLRQKEVTTFVKRGGLFEVEFAHALRDTTKRRALIVNVEQLVHRTRSKHILFTSGANDALEMRSPHDLANFAAVLGLRGSLARESLADVPRRALQRAAFARGSGVQVVRSPSPLGAAADLAGAPTGAHDKVLAGKGGEAEDVTMST